jgi:hypothetical protein
MRNVPDCAVEARGNTGGADNRDDGPELEQHPARSPAGELVGDDADDEREQPAPGAGNAADRARGGREQRHSPRRAEARFVRGEQQRVGEPHEESQPVRALEQAPQLPRTERLVRHDRHKQERDGDGRDRQDGERPDEPAEAVPTAPDLTSHPEDHEQQDGEADGALEAQLPVDRPRDGRERDRQRREREQVGAPYDRPLGGRQEERGREREERAPAGGQERLLERDDDAAAEAERDDDRGEPPRQAPAGEHEHGDRDRSRQDDLRRAVEHRGGSRDDHPAARVYGREQSIEARPLQSHRNPSRLKPTTIARRGRNAYSPGA